MRGVKQPRREAQRPPTGATKGLGYPYGLKTRRGLYGLPRGSTEEQGIKQIIELIDNSREV